MLLDALVITYLPTYLPTGYARLYMNIGYMTCIQRHYQRIQRRQCKKSEHSQSPFLSFIIQLVFETSATLQCELYIFFVLNYAHVMCIANVAIDVDKT